MSFSVDVSEIPRQSISSEEDLDREQSLSPSAIGPPPQDSDDVITEEDTEPESPLSPSHPEKPKGPQTPPKPKGNTMNLSIVDISKSVLYIDKD